MTKFLPIEEHINCVLNVLYNDGAFRADFYLSIIGKNFTNLTQADHFAIFNRMEQEDLIKVVEFAPIGDDNILNCKIGLTNTSKNLYYKYKTYKNYLKQKYHDEVLEKRNKKWDSRTKYITPIIAIVSTSATLILAIFSSFDKSEQKSLRQELQQAQQERDSLKQVLSMPQMPVHTLPIADTVK